MKKLVYIAEELLTDGSYTQGETLAVSFYKEVCEKAAEMQLAHLTKREQEKTTVSVQGFMLDAEDGQTAGEVYDAYISESCCAIDPVIYEVIK